MYKLHKELYPIEDFMNRKFDISRELLHYQDSARTPSQKERKGHRWDYNLNYHWMYFQIKQ